MNDQLIIIAILPSQAYFLQDDQGDDVVVGEEVEEEGEAPIEDAVEYNHRVQVELASMPGYIADALLTADNGGATISTSTCFSCK